METIVEAGRSWENPATLDLAIAGLTPGGALWLRTKGYWVDFFIPCGPTGYPSLWTWLPNGAGDPHDSNENYFQLMGVFSTSAKIAGKVGKPFPIGSAEDSLAIPQGASHLLFYANDREGFYWNNWGSLSVSATSYQPADQVAPGFWSWLSRLVANTHGLPIIIGLLALVSLFLVGLPQGRDVMLSVTEDGLTPKLIGFYVMAALLGCEAWFWARTIINSNYGKQPNKWPPTLRVLLLWTPRLLGAVPFWAAAASIFRDQTPDPLQVAGTLLAGGAMIGAFFARRAWLGKKLSRMKGRSEISDYTGLVVAALSITAALGMLVSSWFLSPTWFQAIGPAGVVYLAVALMIPMVAGLANFMRLTRFPVVFFLLVAAWGFSQMHWSDNHALGGRRIATAEADMPAKAADPIPLDDAVAAWLKAQGVDITEEFPSAQPAPVSAGSLTGGKVVPMVFVASEGGASRAGYWTALALSQLERLSRNAAPNAPAFSQRVFAISSISGGSVGAAAYMAAVHADARSGDPASGAVTAFSGQDFLSPALGGLLFPDLAQRFLPFSLLPDRAESLERSWEIGWRNVCTSPATIGCGDPRAMERPFRSFWDDLRNHHQTRWTPLLFLNGTREEDGRRLIVAPTAIDPSVFPDAVDFYKIEERDLRLSTAILNTARFPIVSPGGVMTDARGQAHGRIIDGGYFDGIGTATLIDLIRAVQASDAARQAERRGYSIEPIVVELNNDDSLWNPSLWRKSTPDSNGPCSVQSGAHPDAGRPIACSGTSWTLDDLIGPLIGLFQARGAHATLAARELATMAEQTGSRLHYVLIHLYPLDGKQLPMNWMASQNAQRRARQVAGITERGHIPGDPCGVSAQMQGLVQALTRPDTPWTANVYASPRTDRCNFAGKR